MYTIDERDTVIPLEGIPEHDAGVPRPYIFANDSLGDSAAQGHRMAALEYFPFGLKHFCCHPGREQREPGPVVRSTRNLEFPGQVGPGSASPD